MLLVITRKNCGQKLGPIYNPVMASQKYENGVFNWFLISHNSKMVRVIDIFMAVLENQYTSSGI